MVISWLPVDLRLKTDLECRLIIGHIALSHTIKWKFRSNRNSKNPLHVQGVCFIFPLTRRRKPLLERHSPRQREFFTSIVSLVFCFDKGFLWSGGL